MNLLLLERTLGYYLSSFSNSTHLLLLVLIERGEERVKDISKRSGMNRVYVSRTIVQLTDKGLVTKEGEGHQTRYFVTDAGREQIDEITAKIEKDLLQRINNLGVPSKCLPQSLKVIDAICSSE